MTDFSGQFKAGRDITIANRDVHIHKSNDTYKSYSQMLPEELRAEEPVRRKRLKAQGRLRRSKVPKWTILPMLGFLIGIYFVDYVQQQIGNTINIFSLFKVFVDLINGYPPYIVIPIVFSYFFILWLLPSRMIFDLLFVDDEVMRRHRQALRDIELLLAEKG